MSTPTDEPIELWCYNIVGGNYCYPAGSPEAAIAGENQAWATPSLGTDPVEVRYVYPSTTSTSVPMECFNLTGGNYCYPAGSPEAAIAAAEEAEYIEFTVNITAPSTTTTVPTSVPPSTVPPSTEFVIVAPGRLADDVHVQLAPDQPVVVSAAAVESPAAVLLPETGTNAALGGLGAVMLVLGVVLVTVTRSPRKDP